MRLSFYYLLPDGGREGSTLRARRCYCFERRIEMRRSFSSSRRSRSAIRCCRWWFSVWSSTECWPTVLMAGPAVLTAELLMSPDIVPELSEHNMEPEPVRSQVGDKSGYTDRIFSILSEPIAPLFFKDFPNEALLIPILRSNAAIVTPLKSIYFLILSNTIHQRFISLIENFLLFFWCD